MKPVHFLLFIFVNLFPGNLFSQYILNGSATKLNCNCYKLTDTVNFVSGSVWNSRKTNLDSSFDFHFNVFLGCIDPWGADGIAFILQTMPTSLGIVGSGLGFQGVSPSVGISLDTWQNLELNDPPWDHITIQLNGQIVHDGNDLAGPTTASANSNNIEDCKWHTFRITWDASTKILAAYFDGIFRLQAQYDLVTKVFNNNPLVYWGFSAATGGSFNLQQVCTSLNPEFVALPDSFTCIGNTINFVDHSESFSAIKNFYWDFDDGTASTLQNPPPHNYTVPGAYLVEHIITGADGCVDTLEKIVNIGSKPVPDFNLYDTCTGKFLGVADKSVSLFGAPFQWTWWLDNNFISSDSLPSVYNLSLGAHQLKLAETSAYGCKSDTITKDFSIHTTPVVAIKANNACIKQPVNFAGLQIDNATNILKWNWNFDGRTLNEQNPVYYYLDGGIKIIHLTADADDGCTSNDTAVQILVEDINLSAGKDTSVQLNKPFTLEPSWSGHYNGMPAFAWSPTVGLSTPFGPYPTVVLENNQQYYLTATTDAGCVATSSVKINAFDKPGILVPNAFTPNNDGLNDILKPRYNGIKHLVYFAIYNRWGQLIFKTSDMSRGWDGNFNGRPQGTQTFVWIINAEGFDNKTYQLKGVITLIK